MPNHGDLHNFGKKVSVVTLNNKEYYLKPRPVTWEWLFFSNSSPLLSTLSQIQIDEFNLPQLLMNLEIPEPDRNSGGLSRKIESSSKKIESSHVKSYGSLLGYAYSFGLMDLLAENIVRTDRFLQVIDLEVVATQTLLPHQTLLLPFKENTNWQKSGIGHLSGFEEDLSNQYKLIILSSFLRTISGILTFKDQITDNLCKTQLSNTPIRVLLRPTKDYADKDKFFLPEESEQLYRGDIPYFFKFLGENKTYYYTKENGTLKEICLSGKLSENAEETGLNFSDLLNSKELIKKIVHGSFYLLKTLFYQTNVDLEISNIKLSKDQAHAILQIDQDTYKCTF